MVGKETGPLCFEVVVFVFGNIETKHIQHIFNVCMNMYV